MDRRKTAGKLRQGADPMAATILSPPSGRTRYFFFSFLAARFSFNVLVGSFLVCFLLSWPLLMVMSPAMVGVGMVKSRKVSVIIVKTTRPASRAFETHLNRNGEIRCERKQLCYRPGASGSCDLSSASCLAFLSRSTRSRPASGACSCGDGR